MRTIQELLYLNGNGLASLTFRTFEEEASDNAHADATLHARPAVSNIEYREDTSTWDVFPRFLSNGRPKER